MKADYFKIMDFDELKHFDKRKVVANVEQLLIEYFSKKKEKLFNEVSEISIGKAKNDDEAVKVLNKIIKKL